MLRAILILPFNVLITLPIIILCFCGGSLIAPKFSVTLVLMLLFFVSGLALMIKTISLFVYVGKGSLAPWNPTQKLIIIGPYAYVRNPMLLGVFLILAGEALLFQSWALLIYLFVFIVINAFYFPLFEEKGLLKRFGEDYADYKRNVPRFIPRLTPYKKHK